jgi:hypothetical protein
MGILFYVLPFGYSLTTIKLTIRLTTKRSTLIMSLVETSSAFLPLRDTRGSPDFLSLHSTRYKEFWYHYLFHLPLWSAVERIKGFSFNITWSADGARPSPTTHSYANER